MNVGAGSRARATEYKCTVYRSKSEAIFARYLDLQTFAYAYFYEPVNIDGYSPDFFVLIDKSCWRPRSSGMHRIVAVFIEYKPAMPTKTYLNELAERFSLVRNKFDSTLFDLDFFCVYGSTYDPSFSGAFELQDGQWIDAEWNWAEQKEAKEAHEYRYDLETIE